MKILPFLTCFETLAGLTFCRQLAVIAEAMLTIPGRITKLSLSRWTRAGGSYRTLNRFFTTRVGWSELLVKFFETHLFKPTGEYILAGDETVVSKAGHKTFGLDRYFSSIRAQVIKGLSFFVFSLINVEERKAYPLVVKQMVRSEAEKAALKQKKAARAKRSKQQKRRGRPPGSPNKVRTVPEFSGELLRINSLLKGLLKLLRLFVKVKYLTLDGYFGHQQAMLMALENELHLISKLRSNAALFEKPAGEYRGRGRRRKYGAKLDYTKLPLEYLKKRERDAETLTLYYQGVFRSKSFASELNVVIIEKINVKKAKVSQAMLFSSDLELGWEKLVAYYGLRFQIEFNFRDAKQHFGLEDFMTRTEVGVETAANLSFLMVLLSAKMLREQASECLSINDLKTHYRGIKYALETIKIVAPKAEQILIERVKQAISRLGSIHQPKIAVSSA